MLGVLRLLVEGVGRIVDTASHLAGGLADFATIDTAFLRRYYLLFFIDVTTREVFYAGITR